ncbi:MAG: OprO/OprP family phosphate-selective porin [Panacagrimonas sp.]
MKKTVIAAAAALFAVSGPALADLAETKGGITIKTDDGRFEAKVGGRIHLDSNIFVEDDDDVDGIGDQSTDIFFRRARLTLEGKAYGWTYKFENDFAGQSEIEGSGFREMWIGTKLGPANVRIGQAKPYRGMEELTSSNEITFMERPFATATSIYGSRQYLTGLFFDGAGESWGWGLAGYNLRNGSDTDNETDGMGGSGRVYFAPVKSDTSLFHIGLTASLDNPTNGKTVGASSVRFVGRSGPSQSLSTSTTDEQTTYGVELAGKAGPFYAQGEYAAATFSQQEADDVDVDTYYVQLSYLITGESRPYDIKKGVFKSPKPNGAAGAWEAKLRYDFIENQGDDITEREVSQLVAGLNWYVNPNVRMMFEYITGDNEADGAEEISGDVITTRVQFGF